MFGWKRRALAAELATRDAEEALARADETNSELHLNIGNLTKHLVEALRERDAARERIRQRKEFNAAIDGDLRADLADANKACAVAQAAFSEQDRKAEGMEQRAVAAEAELARVTKQRDHAWQQGHRVLRLYDKCYSAAVDIIYEPVPGEEVECKPEPPEAQPTPVEPEDLVQCERQGECEEGCSHREPHESKMMCEDPAGCGAVCKSTEVTDEAPPDNSFAAFAAAMEVAGLTARDCGSGRWLIRGGWRLVSVRPNTERGFMMQTGLENERPGNVPFAIALAKGADRAGRCW